MIQYDPKIIRQFAEQLYQQASRIVLSSTIGFGLVGFLLGGAVGGFLAGPIERGSGGLIGGLIGAVLFGLAGYTQGQAKAFTLRLQAQQALCQMQIEENTRDEARV